MSKAAREPILERLRAQASPPPPPVSPLPKTERCAGGECIARFSEQMQSARGEVHRLGRAQWPNWLALELPRRGLRRLLSGTGALGQQLTQLNLRGVALGRYQQPIEDCREQLFTEVEAAISTARCGIAETGTLVLWPDAQEPRMLSLVPPVHIVLLDAASIYPTLADAMREQQWANNLPSNVVLISGPSKTADIEQTLAYGIHGPRELITLLLE